MTGKFAPLVCLGVFLCGCGQVLSLQKGSTETAALEAGNYRLDPDHAVILWKINHLGFSTFVGRFEVFDASLNIDPDNPQGASLDVLIETASVDSGVSVLDEQLRGASFFASEQFPQARFRATGLERTGETTARMTGDLTIRGQTQQAVLDVTYTGGGNDFLRGNAEILGFEAETRFNRSDFGMDFLTPAIADEVVLEVFVEFVREG